jgi:hypothetical protein
MVSLSVAVTDPELAKGLVLVKLPGGVSVAVFASVPDAEEFRMAVTVYMTDPPAGIVTTSLRVPEPAGVKPEAPPVATAVQVSEVTPEMAAAGSEIATPLTVLGPVLAATIV